MARTSALLRMSAVLLLVGLATVARQARADETLDLALLKVPGHIGVMRHAWAPFEGAPPSDAFRIEDCSTQRNLDDKGRADARRIRTAFEKAGVTFDHVYTSPVCRCRETADLIMGRQVAVLEHIDSFFRKPKELEVKRLAGFKAFVAALAPADRALFVTHGSYISALTGIDVNEAVIVVLKRDGKGGFIVVGQGRP